MKWFFNLSFFIIFISCNTRGDKEKHYIPEGFIGKLYIVFEHKKGAEIQYEKEFRVYKIPESGVLKTQFERNLGSFPIQRIDEWLQYYYVDQQGRQLIRLRNYFDLSKVEQQEYQDSVVVFFSTSNQIYINDNEHILRGMVVDTARNLGNYNFKGLLNIPESLTK